MDTLLKKIQMGEDSSFELKDLRIKESKVYEPHRNSMANELAAMANTVNGIFVMGKEK